MLTEHSASKIGAAISLLTVFLILGLTAMAWSPVRERDLPAGIALGPGSSSDIAAVAAQAPEQTGPFAVYLPAVCRDYPWISPFGVEPKISLTSTSVWMAAAADLRANWIRLNDRISWRELQPTEGGPIQWDQLAGFEQELQALKAEGMTPIVIVDDHPEWATVEAYGWDGVRSTCAAIRSDKLEAFATFMRALVARYKAPAFNVHYWELGNEPDVDPGLVRGDSGYGCWGDIADPYYGGERYGQMLQVVAPAIRAEDPQAQVVLGGLLLDSPAPAPGAGHPELFLEGILRAGGGDHFDLLAFHVYPYYIVDPAYPGQKIDSDLYYNSWETLGGMVRGKALFLRELMASYGVDRPLLLDETGLKCNPAWAVCDPEIDPQFFQVQASHVTRSFVRGLGQGIVGLVWYTLDGPGWMYTNLVEPDLQPKPVYIAYQALTSQLDRTRFLQTVDYGPGLEAYAFERGAQRVHVVWTIEDDGLLTISVPESGYVGAFDRDGGSITPPAPVGGYYEFSVGFDPIYLILDDDAG